MGKVRFVVEYSLEGRLFVRSEDWKRATQVHMEEFTDHRCMVSVVRIWYLWVFAKQTRNTSLREIKGTSPVNTCSICFREDRTSSINS